MRSVRAELYQSKILSRLRKLVKVLLTHTMEVDANTGKEEVRGKPEREE